MLTAPDWALGSRYLRENAHELIPFIEKYGPCNLQPEAPEKYFGTLVTGIISQQLPPDVSLAMVKRLEETVGAHNAGINSLCRRKRFMQLRYYAAEGNVS